MQLEKHDNGVYYIHWSEGRRSKRVSTRAKDLAAAKAFLAQWLVMEREQPTAATGFTVSELWKLYDIKHVERNMAAPETARFSWKNLEPHFGAMALAAIDQDCVEEYEKKRRSGKIGRKSGSATVRRELITLRACLNWCAEPKRKIIDPKDIPAFDLPADSAPRDRWLSLDEIDRLHVAATELRRGERLSRVERFLWLALETAARKEAILDLTWDRVDFEAGVIHYDVPGRKVTKKRRASPPISDRLLPVLKRAYKERRSDLVMDNKAAVWRLLKTAAEHAKVAGVSPHVLRHTAASHMARGGVPLYHIAGVLGNSVTMVEKVYAKHSPEALRSAVKIMYRQPTTY
jgi:integrase